MPGGLRGDSAPLAVWEEPLADSANRRIAPFGSRQIGVTLSSEGLLCVWVALLVCEGEILWRNKVVFV